MAVRQRRGASLPRVNHIELGSVAARLDDEGPQVHVGAVNVCAPGNDELGVPELLGLGGITQAERRGKSRTAGAGTNSAVKTRGPQPMEEAAVHPRAIQQA